MAVNFDNNYRTEYTEYILMSGEYLTSDSVYVAAALIFACKFIHKFFLSFDFLKVHCHVCGEKGVRGETTKFVLLP